MPGRGGVQGRMCAAFGLDDVVPGYGVTSREHRAERLQRAVHRPRRCRIRSTSIATISALPPRSIPSIATIEAAEGLPLHLAHCNSMPTAWKARSGFSSAAARLAEASTAHENITVDVGQVMFGQTVTISIRRDASVQRRGRRQPRKKWAIIDGDSNGGGIVPYQLSRDRLSQRRAMGGGARVVPADRRSLARLLHDGSSQRRAIHGLSRSLRAVDGSRPCAPNGSRNYPRPRWPCPRCRRSGANTRFPKSPS